MGLNYLSILIRQTLHRGSMGLAKIFHHTHYDGCNYQSTLGLKLIHVSKRGPSIFALMIYSSGAGIYNSCAKNVMSAHHKHSLAANAGAKFTFYAT